jgi:6-phosphofructokinase 1
MLKIPPIRKKSGAKKIRSIAVLSSGGDAPGMNAAIRAIIRTAVSNGDEVHGIIRGYSGLIEGQIQAMNASSVANIIQRGGTILKTSRCPAFFDKSTRREAANILRRNHIDALVVIGGDGSFAGAHLMEKETGFPTIGVPGTIDNDIPGSDDTIGFDTAVNTAIDAIDRIRDTASSHDRLFLVEVMGRSTGFIAVQVGIGGGAETILVPEEKQTIDSICKTITRGEKRGKTSSIIVVAEGPKAGLSQHIATDLKKRGYSPRVCILGHIQRGGSPTAHDRYLASTLGAAAVDYLLAGYSGAMVGAQADQVVLVPYTKIFGKTKKLEKAPLELARILAV